MLLVTDCPDNVCGWNCDMICHCKRTEIPYYDKLYGICAEGCAGRWTGRDSTCVIGKIEDYSVLLSTVWRLGTAKPHN